MRTIALTGVLVVAAAACGKTDSHAPAAGSAAAGSAAAGSAVTSGAGSATTRGGGSAAGDGSGSSAPQAIERSPKIAAARCGDPCLFLLDAPIDSLAETYKAKCAGMETKDLGFTDCRQLDYARNCIYAAHGLVYKKQHYKKLFGAKPWYEPNPAVAARTLALSAVETANVHELYLRGKACRKNLQISGADYEELKAWFAALPRSRMPGLVLRRETNGGGEEVEEAFKKVSGKVLARWLLEAEPELKAKVAAGKAVSASYEDAKTLAAQHQLLEGLKVADPGKLRSILVDVEIAHGTEEEPFAEGLNLRFLHDDKNHLVAIAAEHYHYD